MRMKFPIQDVCKLSSRYTYPRSDEYLTDVLRPQIQSQCYIEREQLLCVCKWKSPRSVPKAEPNTENYVKEITSFVFHTQDERARIEALTLLDGVQWPTASAILHFCISSNYPIIDVRALWALGIEIKSHQYAYELWEEYVMYCRSIASEAGVSLRTLDKALWQYAKEEQPNLAADDDG